MMGALLNWVTQGRCQNGPPRLIPLPQSPNLDSTLSPSPLSASLSLLAPSNTGASRGTCMPKLGTQLSVPFLAAIILKTQQHPRGAARHRFLPSLSMTVMSRHVTLPITTPRQRNIPAHRCLLARLPACHRPTGSPKTDGPQPTAHSPQPVTSVCYWQRASIAPSRLPSLAPAEQ